jgi:hypothetical protein
VYGQSDYTTCQAPPDTLVIEGENMLKNAINAGFFTSTGIHTALLDFESWAYTPADEQVNPPLAITTAVKLANTHGIQLIVSSGGNYFTCTACWTAAAKAGAYMVAAQTQGGTSLATFESRVRSAVSTVHAANPRTLVMVGIATNTPGIHPLSRMAIMQLSLLRPEYAYARQYTPDIWLNANNWQKSNLCPAADGGPGCPLFAVGLLEQP